MRNTIVIAVICFIIGGCNKDKFTSTPQLKYTSVNTRELSIGQVLEIKLSFTDGEGDLQDSIYVEQRSRNCSRTFFKSMYKLPDFPTGKNTEGNIFVTLGYRVNNVPRLQEPQCGDILIDTCYFRFMLKDTAQHKSDTIVTEDIYLYK